MRYVVSNEPSFVKLSCNTLSVPAKQAPEYSVANLASTEGTIYETITIYTEECLIHPTRGVPQGSVFGPTMFLLVMDDISDYMNKDKNTHTQAFVDDIAIAGTNTQDLQQAFNKIMVAIKDKNMEINTDKCELITEDLNDNIFDETTNQTM